MANRPVQGGHSSRVAVTIPMPEVLLRDHRAVFERLAGLGYDEVWTGEGPGHDAFTPLVLAAAWAPSLRLATGIVPAATRGPAVIAQTIASLCEAAPGRLTVGIGSSSPAIVQGWNAVPYERPLSRMRDLLRFLRSALAGDRVDTTYETFAIAGFRLVTPLPDPAPALLAAALRPRALELAATESDGAIVNWFSAEDVANARTIVPPEKQMVARVKVIPTNDWNEVRAIATRHINAYLHVSGYRKSQEWLGRGESLEPMWDAWASGDRPGAVAAVPDEVIDDLFIWGDTAAIRVGLDRYFDAGATTVVPAIYAVVDTVWDVLGAVARVQQPGGLVQSHERAN